MLPMLKNKKPQLQDIAHSSPAAAIIFTSLKNRDRTRKVTDLRQFLYKLNDEGHSVTKEDLSHVFQQLQDINVGSLIHGRKGKPTRFKWNYSVKRVGRIALNAKDKTLIKTKKAESLGFKKQSRFRIPDHIKSAVKLKKVVAYMLAEIPLRDNISARIEIPVDITSAEIKQVTSMLKSLIQPEFAGTESTSEPLPEVANPGLPASTPEVGNLEEKSA